MQYSNSYEIIAIFTVYKQVFWYLNFANHRTKESFVSRAAKPLIGTLMTIGDETMSIAILWVDKLKRSKTIAMKVRRVKLLLPQSRSG